MLAGKTIYRARLAGGELREFFDRSATEAQFTAAELIAKDFILFRLDEVFQFVVEGEGAFPFRMLTIHQCWPAYKDDAEALAGTSMARRRVILEARFTPAGTTPDSVRGTWLQYGWDVLIIGHAEQTDRVVPPLSEVATCDHRQDERLSQA